MTEPTAARPAGSRDNLMIGSYVAAALTVVGSLGPWGSVLGISVAGTDGDGVFTLILGLVAAATIFLTVTAAAGSRPKFAAHWLTIAAGALVLVIGIIDVIDISSTDGVSAGWGVWLVLLAGGALLIAGAQLARRVSR